jgi:hypothetical protein
MNTDSATWKSWVDLDLEGELRDEDKARLEALAGTEPRVQAERRALQQLHEMIGENRIEVRPGFTERVMAALPRAVWETRASSTGLPAWALPLAAMLVLALGGAMLLGGAEEAGRFTGVGLALLDFLQVTFLAGSGMLFATWRGVGFGLEQLFADSGMNLLAMVGGVVCLNLLFLSMLRRRPRAPAESAESSDG